MKIPTNINVPEISIGNSKMLETVYELFRSLNSTEMQNLLYLLEKKRINIVAIRTYEYSDAPIIKHLFFAFKGSNQEIPYFQLDSDVYQTICNEVIKIIYKRSDNKNR